MKQLIRLSGEDVASYNEAVLVPWDNDAALQDAVEELRAQGERVIQQLPGQQGDGRAMGCDRELIRQDGGWQVVPLTS